MNLTLTDIFDALERNNENTGSAYLDKKPMAYFIRGIGLVKSLEDIEKIVVKTNPGGMPVLIRDVATVQYGSATRYGALVVDTAEAVGGVVMMLKGENAHEVIDNVEERIETIQKSLPDGVKIEPFLNRSDLVGRAIGTVSRNLIEGALIVIFILILLLGNFRAGLIVASVIPLSMLFAISMMRLFGVSSSYDVRVKVQDLLFPNGILYDSQKRQYLTKKVNAVFSQIRDVTRVSEGQKKDSPSENDEESGVVAEDSQISNYDFIEDANKIMIFYKYLMEEGVWIE
jgi:hypothetical protein